jgi:hypothetical protein
MQPNLQSPKNFCGLSREDLVLLATAQRCLLESRELSRVPRDWRSEANLRRIEYVLHEGGA